MIDKITDHHYRYEDDEGSTLSIFRHKYKKALVLNITNFHTDETETQTTIFIPDSFDVRLVIAMLHDAMEVPNLERREEDADG